MLAYNTKHRCKPHSQNTWSRDYSKLGLVRRIHIWSAKAPTFGPHRVPCIWSRDHPTLGLERRTQVWSAKVPTYGPHTEPIIWFRDHPTLGLLWRTYVWSGKASTCGLHTGPVDWSRVPPKCGQGSKPTVGQECYPVKVWWPVQLLVCYKEGTLLHSRPTVVLGN